MSNRLKIRSYVILLVLSLVSSMNVFATLPSKLNYSDEQFDLILSEEEITNRISTISEKINSEYKGKSIVAIVVLKGALCFAVDLIRQLDDPVSIECIRCSSYKGTERGDVVKITGIDDIDIKGKDVLVIDDIFDSGNTLKHVMQQLQEQNPSSIKSIVLLNKDADRIDDVISPDISLFHIENKFVVGYGLDYYENLRGLRGVYVLSR
jgi:hypoxanthine phosphoribosyltransferase